MGDARPDISTGRGARPGWSRGIRGLTVAAILALVAVNAAGVWAIAVARRGVVEEAARLFRVETAARARQLDSVLASTRADLAFLAGSAAFTQVESELFASDPQTASWRQRAVESALLIFMRGHPECGRLLLVSAEGRTLVTAVRRGGVPVVFVGSASGGGAAPETRRELRARFPLTADSRSAVEAARFEAAIDAVALLGVGRETVEEPALAGRSCTVTDLEGVVAGPAPPAGDGEAESAVAVLQTAGWSAASPWSLTCRQRAPAALSLIRPLAERYRLTLSLNVLVMVLAMALGLATIVQGRRRAQLELRALESERVRELERQLFHAERLATAGRLAAGIAHEINNPLEGMANYLHLARADVARADVTAAARRLDGVEQGMRAVADIVRRVLAHADPSSPPMVPLDAADIVRRSMGWVRTRREFATIRFVDGLEPAGPLRVRGNETQLGQVFLNLLLNACEMQPSGGEVRVDGRSVDGRIELEVADRGPGVTAEDSMRIFEPFYSTRQSTGLGLSVCYAIVRSHGGELSVAPRQGGGARFCVMLPGLEKADD